MEFGNSPNTIGCMAKKSLFPGHTHNVYLAISLYIYYMSSLSFPAQGLLDNRTIWNLYLKFQVECFFMNSTRIFQTKLVLWGLQCISLLQNLSHFIGMSK